MCGYAWAADAIETDDINTATECPPLAAAPNTVPQTIRHTHTLFTKVENAITEVYPALSLILNNIRYLLPPPASGAQTHTQNIKKQTGATNIRQFFINGSINTPKPQQAQVAAKPFTTLLPAAARLNSHTIASFFAQESSTHIGKQSSTYIGKET